LVFWLCLQFLLAICLGRQTGKGKNASARCIFSDLADEYWQHVRLPGAMQPALPKIRGIPATLRQSCSRFRVLLLAFNQGF
jgi:hypothetical protein